MEFRLFKLEKRLLFDASVVAAVASAAGLSDHHAAATTDAHSSDGDSSHSSDASSSHPVTADAHSADSSASSSAPSKMTATEHLLAQPQTSSGSPVNILVVSNVIPDAQSLINAAVAEGTKVVTYNFSSDSLNAILGKIEAAADGHPVSSLAFANHGEAGRFFLNNDTVVSNSTLQLNSSLRSFWADVGKLVENGGHIDLLACNLVKDSTTILNTLDTIVDGSSSNHDVIVSGSTDITGNPHSGGDGWILNSGVDAASLFNTNLLSAWNGSLSTFSVTTTSDSGLGSLRQAIINADAASGGSLITFNIAGSGVHTINLLSSLPSITQGVFINGYSQSGSAVATTSTAATLDIVINGGGGAFNGLTVVADNVGISGLNIQNFGQHGIEITGSHDSILGDYIGTNSLGTSITGTGNGGDGIYILGGISNSIGSSSVADRNIIAGNGGDGIGISGGSANSLLGNYIGVNATGTGALANSGNGINISGSSNDIIGSSSSGGGNLISGNASNGIYLSNTSGTDIAGNIMGLDQSGINALANLGNGISIVNGSTGNFVGLEATGSGNLISHNGGEGILIDGSSSNHILGNTIGLNASGNIASNTLDGIKIDNLASGNIIGGDLTADRNIISGNTTNGIWISDATNNIIAGNYIGLNSAGFAIIANSRDGVLIDSGSTGNIIGDGNSGGRNFISGNGAEGVLIDGSSGNSVLGNTIGLNASGTVAANTLDGVKIDNLSSNNTIGGDTVNSRNIISGNTTNGIWISNATNNTVAGNYIGLDSTGAAAIANGSNGVLIDSGSTGNKIGDGNSGGGNIISGNGAEGVLIDSSNSNSVLGNIIGLDASGTNVLSNTLDGVKISGGQSNIIGGTGTTGRNIISGNTLNGIWDANGQSNQIIANYIGTDSTGAIATPNGLDGILLDHTTSDLVGGTSSGSGNVISGNTNDGINIQFGQQATLQSNIIGLNAAGTAALSNGQYGVEIQNSQQNLIGALSGGNIISGNTKDGILDSNSTSDTISYNYIGTNITGTVALPNAVNGVNVSTGTNTSLNNNVISGNLNNGILVDNNSQNVNIQSNSIGVNAAGNAALANGVNGIDLKSVTGASLSGNTVSGNTSNGILVESAASSVTISGNKIGTSSSGTAAIANNANGVLVDGAANTTISGLNIISGNASNGIELNSAASNTSISGNYIGIDSSGTAALGNAADGILISSATGESIVNNIISANGANGVEFAVGNTGGTVTGNYIGTNAAGTAALGNTLNGILVPVTSGQVIGNGNVISGNLQNGIFLNGSTNADIIGNFIGTNAAGTAALPNLKQGINLVGAFSNTIGGTNASDTNVISGNTKNGILISASSNNNIIRGNFIGTNAAGTAAIGNTLDGIQVQASTGNIIGNTLSSGFNVISGNIGNGININTSANNTTILGNIIGLTADGTTAALGNQLSGIIIDNTLNTTIGGTSSGNRNIISGNVKDGVTIQNNSQNVTIQQNYIGTDKTGVSAFSNQKNGIFVDNSLFVTIGSATSGLGNIISGNVLNGISMTNIDVAPDTQTYPNETILGNIIGLSSNNAVLGNGAEGISLVDSNNIQVGGLTASGLNVISGNGTTGSTTGGDGIYVNNSSSFISIINNYIGTDTSGSSARGNINNGIFFDTVAGTDNFIGNTTLGFGNTISGNGANGIEIDNTTDSIQVYKNLIGLNAAGTAAVGNGDNGVFIFDSSLMRIGGDSTGSVSDRNIISGNTHDGIHIQGGSTNIITDNYIGTNAAGTSAIANGGNGVTLDNTTNNTVGRSQVNATFLPGERNVISGNTLNGVAITNGASGNLVMNNLIGTDAGGNNSIANQLNGVAFSNSSNNTIGDTSGDSKNIISGNAQNGIMLQGTSSNNSIIGDVIGLNLAATAALPNAMNGILEIGGSANTIGKPGVAFGNVISGNTQNGISLTAGAATTTVQNNLIGTDYTGNNAIGNGFSGIFINNSNNNTIGGSILFNSTTGTGNLISGNALNGIDIAGTSSINNIQGNFIGTNFSGNSSIANGNDGILVEGGSDNIIGKNGASPANIISGNTVNGIEVSGGSGLQILSNTIGLNVGATAALPNLGDGILVDGTAATTSIGSGNTISGNSGNGVHVAGLSTGTKIISNLIGTSPAGNVAFANGANGVFIDNVSGVTVGGFSFEVNTISGNAQNGIEISGAGVTGASIFSNFIGTDSSGLLSLGNQGDGIFVTNGASNVAIGINGKGNFISGNVNNGIEINNSSSGSIAANTIGLNFAQNAALSNRMNGILFNGNSSSYTVGGSSAVSTNIISGNTMNGIEITGAATNITVNNNAIGLDGTESVIIANGLNGVLLDGVAGNTIGGSAITHFANVISGNTQNGVLLNNGANNNTIIGNGIGVIGAGTASLGNGINGITLDNASNNTIGGTTSAFTNVIGGNTQDGILIINGSSGNIIRGNSIGFNAVNNTAVANGASGIEINGTSSNIIGGTTSATGNIISDNSAYGIYLHNGATLTTVQANFIGSDRLGGARGNTLDGIFIDASTNNTIGGTTSILGNTISSNGANGIHIDNGSSGTVVESNIIGLNPNGSSVLANINNGIYVNNTTGVQIGVTGSGNTISGNTKDGIMLTSSADAVSIQGNLIGTNSAGTSALGNTLDGVLVNGATNTLIGGVGQGNTISGNTTNGIHVIAGNNTQILSNIIGLNKSGLTALPNGQDGILLDGATGVRIGGSTVNQANIISGNGTMGIDIENNSTNISITGNYIGTDITGNAAVGNTMNGVLIAGSNNITIGGAASGQGNVISGNQQNGISIASSSSGDFILQNIIGLNAAGNSDLGNALDGVLINGSSGHTIGGNVAADRNIISGNNNYGVEVKSASGNLIEGNYIGTDTTGGLAKGNTLSGIHLTAGSSNNQIVGNTISGNLQNGVALDTASNNNSIFGNLIGLNAAGSLALGNNLNGVFLDAATNNIIGDGVSSNRNIISANIKDGIAVTDNSTGTVIKGNYIGTDISGTIALGNHVDGISVQGTAGITIGGANSGEGNTISGNQGDGIDIYATAANTTILGNYIGTNATGTLALGNSLDGILSNGDNTVVGGIASGDGNIISGNTKNGVHLSGGTGEVVEGNIIGLNISGSALGNHLNGVLIDQSATGALIGGVGGATRNIISANGTNGVEIQQNASGNTIEGNYIGTDFTGTASRGNTLNGVLVDHANTNTITQNVISGNLVNGVVFVNGAASNVVTGNNIGVDNTGNGSLGNLSNGILVDNSTQNTIGGTAAGLSNIISNNGKYGIDVVNDSTLITIENNFIGTNSTGTSALGNTLDGVRVDNSDNITIGVSGWGNVINGNAGNGLALVDHAANVTVQDNKIGTDVTGTLALGNSLNGVLIDNSSNNTIGGGGQGNTISGNIQNGIDITNGSSANVISANIIGLNSSATAALSNNFDGILVNQSTNNIIGVIGAGNTISANLMNGIELNADTGTKIVGNVIGTNSSNATGIGNTLNGVLTKGSSNDLIGGTLSGAGNIISGNQRNGVALTAGSSSVTLEGNNIGSDSTGTNALGNTLDGVLIDSSSNNFVGSSSVGNIISANLGNGVEMTHGSNANSILRNTIGLSASGTALGNSLDGILVDHASNNIIGAVGAGNTISANTMNGIELNADIGTQIIGNIIGTNSSNATGLGNTLNGLHTKGSVNDIIGGILSGTGNVISGNLENGVAITAGSSSITLEGNEIGTDLTGTIALGNTLDGVLVDSSSSNTIGSALAGNIISANLRNGVEVINGSNANAILNNTIGLGGTGLALGNKLDGVIVNGSPNTIIGAIGTGNTISANNMNGIELVGGAGTQIIGNFIGSNSSNATDLGNTLDGVFVNGSASNIIGGLSSGAGNIISGNLENGIALVNGSTNNTLQGNLIGTDSTGNAALGNTLEGVLLDNSSANTIGRGNIISSNLKNGIEMTNGANSNTIVGNIIGLNVSGTAALGNSLDGILVNNVNNNIIGGATAGTGNTISGNLMHGVEIFSGSGNQIMGNEIGTSSSGLSALGNGRSGVYINGSTNIMVGGPLSSDRNIISSNHDAGVAIVLGSTNITLENNYIGVDVTGNNALGNGVNGVFVYQSSGNMIGGVGVGNVISGNVGDGIDILNGSNNTTLLANMIGLNAAGTAAIANGYDGLYVDGSTGTIVGGTAAGDGNIISGNTANGIELANGSNGTSILGNILGLNASATAALGNGFDGVYVNNVDNTKIGSTTAGVGNTISGNTLNGIELNLGSGTQIIGNIIGSNTANLSGLGNAASGVLVNGSTNTTIGGLGTSARNIIDANQLFGVALINGASNTTFEGNYIGLDSTGNNALGNLLGGVLVNQSPGNTIGGSAAGAGNIISSNQGDGVDVVASDNTSILGNTIGLNAAGTAAVGNALDGVFASNSQNLIIGAAGAGNIISGNHSNGIDLTNGTDGAVIIGNTIGLNVSKTASLGNSVNGILVDHVQNTIIGGSALGAGNVISGNLSNGVELLGGSGAQILNNRIGTNGLGSAAYGNSLDGVSVNGSSNNNLQNNLISGNQRYGVSLINSSTANTLQGNMIGVDVSGNAALGNQSDGVFVDNSSNNIIGGTTVGTGNFISGNLGNGVQIADASNNNTILGNQIGISLSGAALGNTRDGIFVNNSTNTIIGGTVVGSSNVISGNHMNGVEIDGGSATQIIGNEIGTNAAGTTTVGNNLNGVFINGSSNNLVGGTTAAARNVISGNSINGINVSNSSNDLIEGNLIGVNVFGTASLANGADGILANNATNLTVGGVSPAATNIISGNTQNGVHLILGTGNEIIGNKIGSNITGTNALGNAQNGVLSDNTLNSLISNNLISGNHANGLSLVNNDSGTKVQGNFIGTDVTGNLALGNTLDGLLVNGSSNETLGGTLASQGNVISGNLHNGIQIQNNSTNISVLGNTIGLNVSSVTAMGNSLDGINVNHSNNITIDSNTISGNHQNGLDFVNASQIFVFNNQIGLSSNGLNIAGNGMNGILVDNSQGIMIGGIGQGNIISGNAANGVSLIDHSSNVSLKSNFIGTDITGTTSLANNLSGIAVTTSENSIIGGSTVGSGNVISGNKHDGISISSLSNGIQVQGNLIGTDALGMNALPNKINGITISASTNITVGGTQAGKGNVISGNLGEGISLTQGANNNMIVGNIIGAAADGVMAIPNQKDGIAINQSNNTMIGGFDLADSNLIANNTRDGVLVMSGVGNMILGNEITNNGRLGIELGLNAGVLPISFTASTSGPNLLQSYPLILAARNYSGITNIIGEFFSTPNQTFTLQFFSNATGGAFNDGQGAHLIASFQLATNFYGTATFGFNIPTPAGQVISATATSPIAGTSEFSTDITNTFTLGAPPADGGAPTLDGPRLSEVPPLPMTLFTPGSYGLDTGLGGFQYLERFIKPQMPQGFLSSDGSNQMTSTGELTGFSHLINWSDSYSWINREVGNSYDVTSTDFNAVQKALNSAGRYLDMPNRETEVEHSILDLTRHDWQFDEEGNMKTGTE